MGINVEKLSNVQVHTPGGVKRGEVALFTDGKNVVAVAYLDMSQNKVAELMGQRLSQFLGASLTPEAAKNSVEKVAPLASVKEESEKTDAGSVEESAAGN